MRTIATKVDLPSLYNNHVTSNSSEGWTWFAIGTVVELNPPKPPKDALAPHVPVTFVPMPALDAYDGTIATPEDRPFGSVRKGYTSFRENDVIFAKITPCMENGKAAIARGLTNGFGFGSTEFHVLRSMRAVIPEYVFYYIRQESFRKRAEEEMTGSVGQRRVPVEFLRNALMPLPPLAEQKRIVAKVEQLLARGNAARERLAKIPVILKRFCQSVLAAACSGRLTADWRQKNPDVEPANKLLRRILKKKARKQAAKLSIGSASVYKDLPESWTHCSLGSLTKLITKGSSPKWQGIDYAISGVLFITSENVRSGGLDIENKKYVEERFNEVQQRSILKRGDLLTNIVGASIGRSALFDLDRTANINQAVALIRLYEDINQTYMLHVLNSPVITDFMNQTKVDVARANLSLADVSIFPVPLPPKEEQLEVVRRVEALFKVADIIENRVAVATAHAEKLTQAILAKAFRGELLPTEAELARREGRSYEPASVLLERIKVEREAMEKEKRPKKQVVSRGRRHRKPTKETRPEKESTFSADTSESAKIISPDSDSSSQIIAVPPVSKKRTPLTEEKASITVKKHRHETSLRPVPLSDLETDEVMAAFRKACRGRGAMRREDLLKEVSLLLGYQRVASAIQERLKGHLRAAIRRKIIGSNGHEVWLDTKSMDDYECADLVSFLGSVMRLDTECDREEVIRALANYLGFRRLTKGVLGPIKSAINSAIRQGNIVGSRSTIRRIL